jgi:dTDP-4-dehydrorhamnose 3,5-epimerase
LKTEAQSLPEVLLIKPRIFQDDRGRFFETWRDSDYRENGMGPFVQDNISVSHRGVLRGLHLQQPHAQGKLVTALRGRIFDVAVDVRVGSPDFGRWVGLELSEENGWQLYIPTGFLHGFVALTDEVIFSYKCTAYYMPEAELTVRWNDPALAIEWPEAGPKVSARDAAAPLLSDFPETALPAY